MIYPISNLPLSSKHRVSQIKFHPTQPYLAVQSHDRSVEIFRVRNEEEVRKKQARRKKRAKEKSQQEDINRKESHLMVEPDTQVDEMGANFVDYFSPHLVVRASGKVRSFDFGPSETSSKGVTQVFLFFSLGCEWRTYPLFYLFCFEAFHRFIIKCDRGV
jgi:U3 small nucleolar RNA-associated protein 12